MSRNDALSQIRAAIREKRCLEAVYDGHRRRFCPHVLGAKDGELRVLCFQFGGGSKRGLEPGGDWRCLAVAGLAELAPIDGDWRTRPHSQPQTCIDDVDLQVSD